MERTLEIRTLLRLQSILLGIVRVIFTRRQFDLLLLQRKGNLLDVNELQDEAEDIFYGDQVPLDKIISKVQ